MTARLDDVVRHLDTALEIRLFRDYGPNGLQVEGRPEVRRVATGVSANLALLEAAAAWGADLVVVHHGLIWGGGIERVTGTVARRLQGLLSRGMSLAAYHLPLDKHATLGNNAGLADALGLPATRGTFGEVRGHEIALVVELETPLSRAELVARVARAPRQAPPFVFAHGPEVIRRVGLCSGAAGDLVEEASRRGCDAYITGELAERAGELARELGITLVAAGHYATEVYGPIRLAEEIARVFPGTETKFIDVPSPL